MKQERLLIGRIPSIVWGEPSESVWIHVHGKMSNKENAADFAAIAQERGFQTLSFDLPEHGERVDEGTRCDIWNGIADVQAVGEYARSRWPHIRLHGCSLGAFFSLHACRKWPLERCLLQSPIVDMEYLVRQMFAWFGVSEEQLRQEGEIPTPVDTLSWRYFEYVRSHPILEWRVPTAILYGGRDDMQSLNVMRRFADRFGCVLTVSEPSAHPFMEPGDQAIVERWIRANMGYAEEAVRR